MCIDFSRWIIPLVIYTYSFFCQNKKTNEKLNQRKRKASIKPCTDEKIHQALINYLNEPKDSEQYNSYVWAVPNRQLISKVFEIQVAPLEQWIDSWSKALLHIESWLCLC